ncbi:hypothetical protein OF829_15150 [Sphingomonas sp. LB-2]|uniref:hypothetical protein n=1 Tax=Sphingomonas caeni TaxID=2984949 RepID=UPI002231E5E5|nr:hypothetical protein [Sphingomonas caeni]MCW3848571.1 hypothetical protein [Sphingomonas caeni]
MIRYAVPAILIASAFTLTAAAPEQTLEQRLEGLTPGKAVSCISQRDVTQVKGYGNTFLYIQGRNKVWRTETNGGCEGLAKRDDILVTRTTMSQYCRGDVVETHDRSGGHFTGVCSLGEFTPYTKAR